MNDLLKRLESAEEGGRECVIWPRALDKRGRGRIWHAGKLMLAHRWVWEQTRGPIPKGKMLCHHCDNPSCINTDHLYVGTHADNMRDMRERRRYFFARDPERCRQASRKAGLKNNWCRGSRNPRAKLTEKDAAAIRASNDQTRVLSKHYGVDRTTIQRIRRGAAWKC